MSPSSSTTRTLRFDSNRSAFMAPPTLFSITQHAHEGFAAAESCLQRACRPTGGLVGTAVHENCCEGLSTSYLRNDLMQMEGSTEHACSLSTFRRKSSAPWVCRPDRPTVHHPRPNHSLPACFSRSGEARHDQAHRYRAVSLRCRPGSPLYQLCFFCGHHLLERLPE